MIRPSKRVYLLPILVLGAMVSLAVVRTATADEANQEIINMVIDALKSDDPDMRAGAIGIVREIPGPEVTQALARELPNLEASGQVQLLSALADRGDAGALPAVIEATKSKAEAVRVAALKAIGQLGNAAIVPSLAQTAAKTGGLEQKAARESLYRLRGPKIDDAILEALPEASPEVMVELIRAVGERNITAGVATLLKTAKHEDRKVRSESFKVLRVVARPDDLPALVNLTLNLAGASDRDGAEKMVAAVESIVFLLAVNLSLMADHAPGMIDVCSTLPL